MLPGRSRLPSIVISVCLLSLVVLTGCAPPKVVRELRYAVDREKLVRDGAIDQDKLVASVNRRLPASARAVPVANQPDQVDVQVYASATPQENESIPKLLAQTGYLEFRILASRNFPEDTRFIQRALESTGNQVMLEDIADGKWIGFNTANFDELDMDRFVTRQNEDGDTEVLVHLDRYNATGAYLAITMPSVDARGAPALNFNFNPDGAARFAELTTDHAPMSGSPEHRCLGIILDDVLLSAPSLREPIIGGRGQISGRFTMAEIDFLTAVFDAGALPRPLRLISDKEL